MKTPFSCSLLALSILLFVFSCKKKEESPLAHDGITDVVARQYVSAYTQGMINESDPIEFRFLQTPETDPAIIQKAIQISPNIKFRVEVDKARNSYKIIPVEKLKRGQGYEIEVLLHKIFKTSGKKKLLSRVQVFEQFLSVQREGLVIDEQDKSHIQLR